MPPLLPDSLKPDRDAAIAHALNPKSAPPDLTRLYEWLETDGWDAVISGDEQCALNIKDLADYSFNDRDLRDALDISEKSKISDEMRVQYARDCIEEAASDYDELLFPSVMTYELTGDDGKTAVLGCLVEIHGQSGPAANWLGIFKTREEFLQKLPGMGYWLDSDLESIDDQTILSYWKKEEASSDLYLDSYDRDVLNTVWCWKRNDESSQEFDSEEAALEAWRNDDLVFTRMPD